MTVHSHVDAQVYTAFSTFNNFTLYRRALTLKLFPLLMAGLGIANLLGGYALLGIACILLGILLPLAYIGFHRRALANQIAHFNLDTPRLSYKVSLDQTGVSLENGKEKARYPYEMFHCSYRVNGCIYLYLTKTKCFILPAKDFQDGVTEEELWVFLQEKLGEQRTIHYNKK